MTHVGDLLLSFLIIKQWTALRLFIFRSSVIRCRNGCDDWGRSCGLFLSALLSLLGYRLDTGAAQKDDGQAAVASILGVIGHQGFGIGATDDPGDSIFIDAQSF